MTYGIDPSRQTTQTYAHQHISSSVTSSNFQSLVSQDQEATQTQDSHFTGSDLIDIINPLQHIPFISQIYREISGDQITPHAEIIGGGLFGGPLGAVASTANVITNNQDTALAATSSSNTAPLSKEEHAQKIAHDFNAVLEKLGLDTSKSESFQKLSASAQEKIVPVAQKAITAYEATDNFATAYRRMPLL